MPNSTAYLNGAWIPSQDLSIPLDDLGFTLGITVVERMRTFGGEVFRLEEHLERLKHSLEIVGWDASALLAEVTDAIEMFMQKNRSLIAEGDDWNVISFVTPGKTADAAKPTVCVHGQPLPFHNWSAQFVDGLAAVLVNTRQTPENCWPTELKCRSRMHYYLADREAHAAAPGSRGILLDQDGFVGEGTTANVVAYFTDRGLVTPHRHKVLPGVSQQVLYELADSLGIVHSEADLLPEELAVADELYFTSTSICLLPVIAYEGNAVGDGKPGKIYRQLLAAWSDFVGVDIAEQARKFSSRD